MTTQNDFENGSQSQNNVMSVFATHGYKLSIQTTNESFVNNVNLHFDNQNIVQLSNVSTEIHQSNDGTLRDTINDKMDGKDVRYVNYLRSTVSYGTGHLFHVLKFKSSYLY